MTVVYKTINRGKNQKSCIALQQYHTARVNKQKSQECSVCVCSWRVCPDLTSLSGLAFELNS